MGDGYTHKVLRVDLTTEKVSTEPLNMDYAKQFIGGKGLGARYLFDELKPGTDPLSPDNVLTVWTGPAVASRGRCASCVAPGKRGRGGPNRRGPPHCFQYGA